MHITNEREYLILGLRRSGNHAIINWLLENQKEDVTPYFLNDVLCYENPFQSTSSDLLQKFSKHIRYEDEIIRPSSKKLIAISYEDMDINECIDPINLDLLDQYVGKAKQRQVFLILRDPLNFFASRYISENKATQAPKIKIALRKAYFALGKTFGFDGFFYKLKVSKFGSFFKAIKDRLSDNSFGRIPLHDRFNRKILVEFYKNYCRQFISNPDIIPINFTEWYQSKEYRVKLAQSIPLPSHKKGVKEQAVYSNFDNRIAPTERWHQFANDDFFKEIFLDNELIELSIEIFGKNYFDKFEELLNKQNDQFYKKAL